MLKECCKVQIIVILSFFSILLKQALERELNEKEEAFFQERNKNDQVSQMWIETLLVR